jgi:hypothetical protein
VAIVMELLVGQPLDALLAERGALSLFETLTIAEQVAGALVEAHGEGLVHRDLKPANIFVTRVSGAPFCKVLDFGIARILDDGATKLTATGQVFGTPRYMSPEQAASTSDVDGRSDLYSLGLILFECATGESPFRATTALQYLAAHTTQIPPPLTQVRPDAPPELEELVTRLLQKEAGDRPPDAEWVRQALVSLRARVRGSSTEPILTAAAPPAPGPTVEASGLAPTALRVSAPSASRWGTVLMGAAAATFGGALAWGLWGAGDDPTAVEPAVSALAAVDAGSPDASSVRADAVVGSDVGAPDGRLRPADAGASPRRRRRPSRTKRPKVVSGPRGMEIEIGDAPAADVAALAADCTRSKWSGLSELTTAGCPADCAILVDSICAGRTPATGRAVAPGRREVVVACPGEIPQRREVVFREGRTGRFDCR